MVEQSSALTLSTTSPALTRVLGDIIRAHGITDVAVTEQGVDADITIDPDSSQPVRLGTVMDWALARARNPRALVPDTIFLSTGQFMPRTSVFISHAKESESVRLTDRERDLLLALYRAPHRTLAKDAILSTIWGYVPGLETHTLETHIYRLRQKIETDPATPCVLVTQPNAYQLIAD